MFLNHYECPGCDCVWSDALTCPAADDCPACGLRDVSPQDSLAFDDGREVEPAEAPEKAPARRPAGRCPAPSLFTWADRPA